MSAERKIITVHVFPPIPMREFDWLAHFEGADEHSPVGYGPTEESAKKDLIFISDMQDDS